MGSDGLGPLDVTPLLSSALRYSRATDFRCSSVKGATWGQQAIKRLGELRYRCSLIFNRR